jgi:hypothetical protein
MYIDFKNSGGRCELTSFYKSRRGDYDEKDEFIALTPIDIPATTPRGTTALLERVLELMKTTGKTECTLTIDGGEFFRVAQLAHNHERYKGIFIMPGGFHMLVRDGLCPAHSASAPRTAPRALVLCPVQCISPPQPPNPCFILSSMTYIWVAAFSASASPSFVQKAYLAAVGTRFAGTGLAALWVESGLCMGDASAKSCESATHFNRSLRAHKITWEALSKRLVKQWKAAESPAPTDHDGGGAAAEMDTDADGDIGAEMHAARVWGETVRSTNKQFDLWLSYLDCIDIAIDFTRAKRDADLSSYMVAVRRMAPLFFEYDKGLYCRIVTLHLAMLVGVEETHPSVSRSLESGHGLSFRRSLDAFTSISMDLLCEHWNKVCKSPRGITYCATKPTLRDAWFKSMPERARTYAGARSWVPAAKKKRARQSTAKATHDQIAMRKVDVAALNKLDELLERIGCPFEDRSDEEESTIKIRHLTRGGMCPDDAAADLCAYLKSGEKRFQSFWEERINNKTNELSVWHPIKFRKSLTMMSGAKGRRGKSKAIVVQTLEHFLRYCAVYETVKGDDGGESDLTLDLMSEFELGDAPWSLFYETLDMRRPSNKAALLQLIYSDGCRAVDPSSVEGESAYVVDFCAVMQSIKPDVGITFGQFVDRCVATCVQQAMYHKCSTLAIICDQYWPESIKNSTRIHRGDDAAAPKGQEVLDTVVPDATVPKSKFSLFLKSGKNKKELLALLEDRVPAAAAAAVARLGGSGVEQKIETVHLLTEGVGFVCRRDGSGGFAEMVKEPMLECRCEEADQGILSYLNFNTTHIKSKNIFVSVADTDVHVAMLVYAPEVAAGVTLAATRGKGADQLLVDVHAARQALVAEHGEPFVKCLIALHVLSGCDTTSSLFGKGKATFWKVLVSVAKSEDPEHVLMMKHLQLLGNKSIEDGNGKLKSEVVHALEMFAMLIYGHSGLESLAAIRALCWRAAKSTPATMPPTPRGWLQHVLRSHHQCQVWIVSVEGGDAPIADGWGWRTTTGGQLEPVPFEGEQAPPQLLANVHCACGTRTKSETSPVCVKGGCRCWNAPRKGTHKCTVLCKCDPARCQNRAEEVAHSDVEQELADFDDGSMIPNGSELEPEGEDGMLCEECYVAIGEQLDGCWICVGCQDSVVVI